MEVLRFAMNDPAAYGLPEYRIPAGAWRNGLVVRMPNHLGDAVMALPALAALRKILPKYCGLFVVAPESFRPFYSELPMVDSFTGLEKPHANWSLYEILKVRQLMAGAGVFFNNSPRDVIAMRLAGVRYLYGTGVRFRSLLLTGSFKFNPQQVPGRRAGEHLSARYLAMAMALGAPPWDGSLPEFRFLRKGDEFEARLSVVSEHPAMLLLGPGAAYGEAKCYGARNYNRIARWWIEKGGIVAVAGSSAEAPTGQEVCAGLPANRCFDFCGRTGLRELLMLVRFSRFMVCNDSGIMHLGAAVGRPGIALFGSTDPTATGPISPAWQCFSAGVECAPCFRHVCPAGGKRCMEELKVESVIGEMEKIFGPGRF